MPSVLTVVSFIIAEKARARGEEVRRCRCSKTPLQQRPVLDSPGIDRRLQAQASFVSAYTILNVALEVAVQLVECPSARARRLCT